MDKISHLPSGTVTFLFTDVEGSTQLWEKYPQEMRIALAKHDLLLRDVIETNHGHVIKTTGDGIHAVFEKAIDALQATVRAQHEILLSSFHLPLKIRMGLHTGEAELRDNDYYGQALNRAARIMSTGHGGQILLSGVTADIVRSQLPEDTSLLDLGEHRLKDLVRPERIHQIHAAGLAKDFPPLRSLNTLPNNLPVQLTSFIGREHEISETRERLQTTRLLTLIGPGGTGKTRLSLQLAAHVLTSFADGAWLIELAPLSDPNLILQAIASVFGIRAQPGMPLTDIVINYLRAKHLLLILDNCEHLIEACARISEQFLKSCASIKIIASSREAFGIPGEAIYRVPSLSLPDGMGKTPEALAACEASRLFVERARSVNPAFELNSSNAAAIAQICHRLDGIPLALELAAARSGVFSADQIAARLDDRFKLLTGGSRTALPRQQTLRALIDWSYDHLQDEECQLLRRLSVFAGGWTLEAAEAISPQLDVLSLLPQLVNKSLVTVEDGPTPRYRLLETIRQYARDKLLDAGEAAEVRDLHLKYFVDFAERAGARIEYKEAVEWIPRLDAEYDNFRTAFDWGLNNHIESCLRLVGTLANYWFRRGHGAEGIDLATMALKRAETIPYPQDERDARGQMLIRARALHATSFLFYSQGDNPNAYKVASQCITLARQLGETQMLATALAFSGSAKLFDGNHAEAVSEIEEAVAITRRSGEKYELGMALGMMAQMEMIKNNNLKAAEDFEREALLLTADGENTWTMQMLYFGTGRGAMFRGDYATARERFAKCLPIFEEMKDEHRANMIHSEFAHIDRYEGKYKQAEDAYRRTIRVWERLGHRAAIAHQLESFAFIAIANQRFERAARLFGAAEALREKINIQMSAPEVTEYQGELEKLRAGIDESLLLSNWAEGRGMSLEEAVAFAVNEQGDLDGHPALLP